MTRSGALAMGIALAGVTALALVIGVTDFGWLTESAGPPRASEAAVIQVEPGTWISYEPGAWLPDAP